MLFNFVFIQGVNGVPRSSLVIPAALNGKRCRIKLLGYAFRVDASQPAWVQQVLRFDFVEGVQSIQHAGQFSNIGGDFKSLSTGIPIPSFSSTSMNVLSEEMVFEGVLWGERLTASVSRCVDPPNTPNASLVFPLPLIYMIFYFKIEAIDE